MATLNDVLKDCNPNDLADVLRQLNNPPAGLGLSEWLGHMQAPLCPAIDITSTPGVHITLDPPALLVQGVQVITGADAGEDPGVKLVLPSSGTPISKLVTTTAGPLAGTVDHLGTCTLSDDGKTLTFSAGVKVVKVQYIPRPGFNVLAQFGA